MATLNDMEFWAVWSEDGGSPTVKHFSEPRAREEAKRLALGAPGRRFIVLKAVFGFCSPERLDEIKFDDIPF